MSQSALELAEPHERRSTLRSLRRLPDFLMIGSIITLVVLVSLPQLRAFVVTSNEEDAREMTRRLAAWGATRPVETRGSLADWIEESAELGRRLQDGTLLGAGELLCFHGYCFTLERDPLRIVAWPENAGESGLGAYVSYADGTLWHHSNGDGRWSGPGAGPRGAVPAEVDGWTTIRR